MYEFAKGRADKTINAGNPLGYSGARNAGIEAAKYGIVVCVDADTRIANSDIFEKAEASVKSGCVGGMTNTVPDKETCGEGAFYGWTSMAGRYLTPLMNIPFIRDYIPTVGNGQFMYFRNGLGLRFDESLGSQEDVGFVDTMRECGKVGFIDSGQIVTSGRRFRKDGPALSWFNRAKRWLNYTNGETSALATAPAPVMA